MSIDKRKGLRSELWDSLTFRGHGDEEELEVTTVLRENKKQESKSHENSVAIVKKPFVNNLKYFSEAVYI